MNSSLITLTGGPAADLDPNEPTGLEGFGQNADYRSESEEAGEWRQSICWSSQPEGRAARVCVMKRMCAPIVIYLLLLLLRRCGM